MHGTISSSPAKAGDPVITGLSEEIEAWAYWMPAFAGMTNERLGKLA
jgi:hypothetical protein